MESSAVLGSLPPDVPATGANAPRPGVAEPMSEMDAPPKSRTAYVLDRLKASGSLPLGRRG